MIKALKALTIALPVVAGALVSPAVAQAGLGDCPHSNFCAWEEDNWEGRWVRWNQGVDDINWEVHRGIGNDAESLYNTALSSSTVPDNVQTYYDNGYVGRGVCVLPGESYDFAMNDDEYDSHTWEHSCG